VKQTLCITLAYVAAVLLYAAPVLYAAPDSPDPDDLEEVDLAGVDLTVASGEVADWFAEAEKLGTLEISTDTLHACPSQAQSAYRATIEITRWASPVYVRANGCGATAAAATREAVRNVRAFRLPQ